MKKIKSILFITGGTGEIGLNMSKVILKNRIIDKLILTYCNSNSKKLNTINSILNEISPKTKIEFIKCDLTSRSGINFLIKKIRNLKIKYLINCYGLTERSEIWDTTEKFFDKMINANIYSTYFISKIVSKNMIKNKIKGSILNIISTASYSGQSYTSLYTTTKGSLISFTKNLAISCSKFKIRVNAINLGWSDTKTEEKIRLKYHNSKSLTSWKKSALRSLPFNTFMPKDNIGKLADFCLSNDSYPMFGSIIDFDQGVVGFYRPKFKK